MAGRDLQPWQRVVHSDKVIGLCNYTNVSSYGTYKLEPTAMYAELLADIRSKEWKYKSCIQDKPVADALSTLLGVPVLVNPDKFVFGPGDMALIYEFDPLQPPVERLDWDKGCVAHVTNFSLLTCVAFLQNR